MNLPRRRFLQAAAVTTLAAAAGCADVPDDQPVVSGTSSPPASATPSVTPTASPSASGPPIVVDPPDPAAVKANELGQIPVLMHHRLVATSGGDYDMTPAYFRAELERLRREHYYPVRTVDLVRGALSYVPAGRTPVVLTFDDSTPGQYAVDAAGRIEPGCAVGIMLAFRERYPDFPATASLYLNRNPFGLRGAAIPRALRQLHQLGFELGNHTWSHPNLRTLGSAEVADELGRLSAMVAQAVPGSPRTMALPLGVRPRQSRTLVSGGRGTTAYRNEGVLLVGAEPARSPFDRDFDPLAIPRIRSSSAGPTELTATYWLDRLAAHPEHRYVAAGNPGRITAPRSAAADLDPRYRSRARWY